MRAEQPKVIKELDVGVTFELAKELASLAGKHLRHCPGLSSAPMSQRPSSVTRFNDYRRGLLSVQELYEFYLTTIRRLGGDYAQFTAEVLAVEGAADRIVDPAQVVRSSFDFVHLAFGFSWHLDHIRRALGQAKANRICAKAVYQAIHHAMETLDKTVSYDNYLRRQNLAIDRFDYPNP